MIWEILLSFIVAAIAYQVIRRLRNAPSLPARSITVPGHLRELGPFESMFQSLFKEKGYLISSNIIIKSKICMDNGKVKEALRILAQRHPLLQAAISEAHRGDGKHYHFTKMASFKIDYQGSDKMATEPNHWHDVMTKMIRESLNDRDGPLWRCCRLRECIDSESNMVTNCFVFTFHHAIIDGSSRIMLFKELLRLLDQLHRNEVVSRSTYELCPPMETLIADKIRPQWWERIGLKIITTLLKMGLYSLKSKTIDAYFNKYPVICNLYPNVQPELKAIFTSFSKLETRKLLYACKQHGCTVNSAITAAANMAMADILQSGRVTKAQWISSRYLVNCRRHINVNKNKNLDYLGMCIAPPELKCYVPPFELQSFSFVFWKVANDINVNVSKTVKSEAHLQELKLLPYFSIRQFENVFYSSVLEHHGGRYGDRLFTISNVGRFDEISNADSLFGIEQTFVIAGDHNLGPLFEIFFISVNGVLCYSFVYFPHVTAKEQEEEFNSKFLEILKRAFNED